MGILKGSVSLSRYRLVTTNEDDTPVEGKASARKKIVLDKKSLDLVSSKLRKYQAGELKIGRTGKELAVGWTLPSILNPDEEDRHGDYWDLGDCELEEGYLLRIRVERKKIPLELLQILFKQRVQEQAKEDGEAPGRGKKTAIKDDLKESLSEMALPTVSYIDAYLRKDGTVLLFSTAKSSKEIFEDLFRNTFAKPLNLSLLPITQPLMGMPSTHEDIATYLEQVEPLLPSGQLSFAQGQHR